MQVLSKISQVKIIAEDTSTLDLAREEFQKELKEYPGKPDHV